jgi:hypothetical protein
MKSNIEQPPIVVSLDSFPYDVCSPALPIFEML